MCICAALQEESRAVMAERNPSAGTALVKVPIAVTTRTIKLNATAKIAYGTPMLRKTLSSRDRIRTARRAHLLLHLLTLVLLVDCT